MHLEIYKLKLFAVNLKWFILFFNLKKKVRNFIQISITIKEHTVPQMPHHGLGEVLDKLLQRGALQDLEDRVLHFLLVVHVIALMTAKLVLGHHLPREGR